MKKGRMKDDKNNSNENIFSDIEIEKIDLLKQQMLAAILGGYAELLFYRGSLEEIQEIYRSKNNGKEFINSDKTFLEAAQLFLASQLIFTKVAFQNYYLLIMKNIDNNTCDDLGPAEKINISCILNSIGNIYFLNAVEEIYERRNNEPIIGD